MNVDFAQIADGIGRMMAAARHDHATADPADVGLNGVPVIAWRLAYIEGCKDMANAIVAAFPSEQFEQARKMVSAAFKIEADRLAATAAPSPAVTNGEGS